MFSAFAAGLPQVLFLRPENAAVQQKSFPAFHWGYIIEQPTAEAVMKYLGFTFGLKWVFIFIALFFLSRFQRLFFVAISSLLGVAFLVQVSEEVLANHKFINIWLIIINLLVAYGFWRLWSVSKTGRIVAVILLLGILPGGIIDLFPFRNDYAVKTQLNKEPLVEWLVDNTRPKDLFLTEKYIHHPILYAGRRIFHGHTYFTWSAGYRTDLRDVVYKQMLSTEDHKQLIKLLNEYDIDYVAIDNGLRQGEFKATLNERVYESYFEKVYLDQANQYAGLVIYKVPPGA